MPNDIIVAAFNEWMREYTEDPEAFEATETSVARFLEEQSDGTEPSYGADCAALLQHYVDRLTSKDLQDGPPA